MKAGVILVALCLALCLGTPRVSGAMDHSGMHGDSSGDGAPKEPCAYMGFYPLYYSAYAADAASPTNGHHVPSNPNVSMFFMPDDADPMIHNGNTTGYDMCHPHVLEVPCQSMGSFPFYYTEGQAIEASPQNGTHMMGDFYMPNNASANVMNGTYSGEAPECVKPPSAPPAAGSPPPSAGSPISNAGSRTISSLAALSVALLGAVLAL